MKIIGYIVTTVGLWFVAAIVNGWTISKLWLWFFVPTFNLPPLTIPAALGLSLIVSYLTHQEIKDKDSEKEYWLQLFNGIFKLLVKAGFCLVFGLIVKSFL